MSRVLVVRLGAMGDVLHALPAVSSLKAAGAHVSWAIESRWLPLLEGNPDVDERIEVDRSRPQATLARLRAQRYEAAIDFQGLIKSAAVARASGADQVYGFSETRERAAGMFYSRRIEAVSAHVVDRNLELARAAGGAEASAPVHVPEGAREGSLPDKPFVLANPLAGWGSKQWPIENFIELGRLVRSAGFELVLNHWAPIAAGDLPVHVSGLRGLIWATRRAVAVVGLDSGPLHLAAALGKPGVAIFGPTDPARNGPYGGTITVLRAGNATTTYKRGAEVADSMKAVTPEQVWAALKPQIVR